MSSRNVECKNKKMELFEIIVGCYCLSVMRSNLRSSWHYDGNMNREANVKVNFGI